MNRPPALMCVVRGGHRWYRFWADNGLVPARQCTRCGRIRKAR